MKNLTWQNPEQLFVAQVLINKVKSKCCGIKDDMKAINKITDNIDSIIKYVGVFEIYFSVFLAAVGVAGWIGDYNYDGWRFVIGCFIYALVTFFSSLPIIGFSYIIKAAIFYLRSNNQIEDADTDEID